MDTTTKVEPERDDVLRRTLIAMRQMRSRIDELEVEHAGPIAIVGMGCRFPGGAIDAESYWQLASSNRNGVRELPQDRWDVDAFYSDDPEASSRMYTKHIGCIDNPGRHFDAGFFGISPREATATDPQHRLLLEVSWEALEHAGLSADRLVGSKTGVFIGISTSDYAELRYDAGGFNAIDPYWALSVSSSFAAGRIAHSFGFQGPTLPIDTACSSSLVATHMAVQALRRGECDLALAGGVNLILSPLLMIYFSKLRALSPRGVCRTFDAGADGYVRGEGCGMIVLKRLCDAMRDGDPVLAVLRGSAVNHDGQSGGMTVPNGLSQQALIRKALKESGIQPEHVGYIEAHGTGTPLGDPIEMQALAATYGRAERVKEPLVIGSAKTQIGHLEAAAGVAGLCRAILALQHRKFPAHLHFEKLNPHIEAALGDRFKFRISSAGEPWPDPGHNRAAAVSSFGINGTNAHIVLEQAPVPDQDVMQQRNADVLMVSAKTAEALRALVGKYRAVLSNEPPLAALCHTAAVGRAHFGERAAFVGKNPGEISQQIETWLQSDPSSAENSQGLALVFPDSTTGLERIAPELEKRFPAFAKALAAEPQVPRGHACMLALFELWRSYGLSILAVLGQGTGQAAAAVAAGALDLSDGARLARKLNAGEKAPTDLVWQQPKRRWYNPVSGKEIRDGKQIDWTDQTNFAVRLPPELFLIDMEPAPEETGDGFISRTLAELYRAGFTPDCARAEPDTKFEKVPLPFYPFQRKEYWDGSIRPKALNHPKNDTAPNILRPLWEAVPLHKATSTTNAVQDQVVLLTADTLQAEAAVACFASAGITARSLVYAGGARKGEALVFAPDATYTIRLSEFLHAPLIDLRFLAKEGNVGLRDLLPVLQALPDRSKAYWLATRNAFAVAPDDLPESEQTALWGMVQSLRAERPDIEVGLVDIDGPELETLINELANGPSDQAVAWRNGQRYIRNVELVNNYSNPLELRGDASYLATGGLGGIGQKLVPWLVSRGARHIVIPSRQGADDPRAQLFSELPAEIQIVDCDLSDRKAISQMVAAIDPPLAGVFHAAGVTEDGLLMDLTQDSVSRVMAAKARAADALDAETKEFNLDHFVLFSSMAGVSGAAGQAAYAAANAALQTLAHRRKTEGRSALCINWGLWDGLGLAAALNESDLARLARQGICPMPPEQALSALETAMAGKEVELMIGMFDAPAEERTTSETSTDWLGRIKEADGSARVELVAQCLTDCAGRILGSPATDIANTANLFELGFDSLMVMDLVKSLKSELGLTLYPREIYQRPVLNSLIDYVVDELEGSSSAVTSSAGASMVWAAPKTKPPALNAPVPDTNFLLSAPRSGSTLLRVMLAGHPDLFVPPELHLMPFTTMADRDAALAGTHLDEGLVRALMELRQTDADVVKAEVADMVKNRLPVQEVYRLLQREADGRQVIDKSPSYAAHAETLDHIELLMDNPRHIHLVRHPVAVIESFARMRMEKLIGFDGAEPYALAETIWLNMTRNILALSKQVGEARALLVRYEDLILKPEAKMHELTAFLGVNYDSALIDPYSGDRMTDGVNIRSASVGDPNFTSHHEIDKSLAENWRMAKLPQPLGEEAAELARSLGYDLPSSGRIQPGASLSVREEQVDGQGLKLTLCRWGDPTAPAVVCLHGILEQGAIWADVAETLVDSGLQVIAPDLRGHGRSDWVAPSAGYRIDDFVADLNIVLQKLSLGKVVLVGLSLGAAIAASFAAARPETIKELILVEPPAPRSSGPTEAVKLLRAQLDAPVPVGKKFAAIKDVVEHLKVAYPELSHEAADRLARRGTRSVKDALTWTWDPRLRSPIGIGSGRDVTGEILDELTVPYRLVFGAQGDLLTARDWKAACNEYLRDIVVLPGGHHLHLSVPRVLARMIDPEMRQPEILLAEAT